MKEKTICRGDLFYYDFGTRTGSVQSGTRPVLVIQEDDYNRNAPTIIVAAVTGVIKKRYLPSHILLGQEFGLKKPSMVLLEQLQTVNKDELRDYIGTIEDEQLLRRINITLKKTFGLWIYKEEKKEKILSFDENEEIDILADDFSFDDEEMDEDEEFDIQDLFDDDETDEDEEF